MSIQEKNSGGPVATCIYANPVGKEEEEEKKVRRGNLTCLQLNLTGLSRGVNTGTFFVCCYPSALFIAVACVPSVRVEDL